MCVERDLSNAETHVDILRQEIVGELVFLEEVGVDACACEGASEEEAEEAVDTQSLALETHDA